MLLIQAHLGRSSKQLPCFPLGLAYLLGNLKNHECTVFDPNTAENPSLETEKIIEKTNPDVICFSLRNIDTGNSHDIFSYFEAFVSLLRFVKRLRPHAKIVVGGTGFSLFANEIMAQVQEIDYGVFLEGEESFPRLLENLHNPEHVDGIYFRRNGQILFTGKGKPVDLERLHAPPREFPELHLESYTKVPHSIGIQTKRGCAFECAYCTYPYIQGKSLRLRSPKNVVDEIENLVNLYNVETFFFVDTVFNFPIDHARRICEELIKRKLHIKWRAWFREDFVNKKFITEARNSGCNVFEFSPDGGSEKALRILQKGIRIENIIRAYEAVNAVEGVKFRCNFMCNIPAETLTTVTDFYKFLFRITTKYIKKLEGIDITNIRIYNNTRIYQIALREGVINEKTNLLAPVFYNPSPFNTAYAAVKPFLLLEKFLNNSVSNYRNALRRFTGDRFTQSVAESSIVKQNIDEIYGNPCQET